jgi:hypothetical protein
MTWKEFYEMFFLVLFAWKLEGCQSIWVWQVGSRWFNYEVEFTRLSKYVEYLVQTKKRKIKRFVQGLNSYLFKAIEDHKFKIYSAIVDFTRAIEAWELEDELSLDLAKKPKVVS